MFDFFPAVNLGFIIIKMFILQLCNLSPTYVEYSFLYFVLMQALLMSSDMSIKIFLYGLDNLEGEKNKYYYNIITIVEAQVPYLRQSNCNFDWANRPSNSSTVHAFYSRSSLRCFVILYESKSCKYKY